MDQARIRSTPFASYALVGIAPNKVHDLNYLQEDKSLQIIVFMETVWQSKKQRSITQSCVRENGLR